MQIRGSEPGLSNTTIDGVVVPGRDPQVRQVDLDTIPANIVGGLTINKALSANQPGDVDGRMDDTPPGGALVFERWKHGGSRLYSVLAYYTAQTLEGMRPGHAIKPRPAPESALVFIPGCGLADGSCAWDAFQHALRTGGSIPLSRRKTGLIRWTMGTRFSRSF